MPNDKIDSLKLGTSTYDIDLPPDAEVSITKVSSKVVGVKNTSGAEVLTSTGGGTVDAPTITQSHSYEEIILNDDGTAPEPGPAINVATLEGNNAFTGSNSFETAPTVNGSAVLTTASTVVNTVGGASGTITLGTGLTMANNELSATAPEIDVDSAMSSTSENPVQNKVITAALGGKVDTVSGKGLSTNDFTNTYKNNVDANTTARHTHTNKSILDDIEAAYTTAEQTKLAGIEAGAEVNTVDSVAGKTGDVTLVKGDVGLGNVDNTSDLNKPISTATQTALDAKQVTLVSGTNIKTINNESILGSGNIEIEIPEIDVDDAMSSSSENPVQNKVITAALGGKVDTVSGKGLSTNDFTDAYKDDVDANTAARHTHSNKAVLDATTASYTTAEQTKLGGIEAGAQVNAVNKVNNKTGDVTLTKSDVGLGNVDNKSTTTIKSEFTGAIASGNTGFVTGDAVYQYIDGLPEPMVFKGTLGTGGTITSLPTAAAANEGFTYKVITAGTYASQAAKVGDVFVSNGSAWVLIPAGDTDSDTWREVKVNGTSLLGSGVSTGAVNFKNGSNITVTGSGNDITIASSYTDTNQTIKGNGTTFGANDVINIVGDGATTVTADTTNKKITISTPTVTDHNQTVKGNGSAFGADAAVNIVGGGATTVTADTTNNKITISTPAVTDTNQKVKAGSVTFGADDVVSFEGSGIVSVTGDATNDKITISASHQSIKTLDTTATTAQSTNASEAITGSGKVTLHKVAKTGTYSDLIGTPSLATVATSGSYNDLSNKPTIPAAQVNANWNATSGVAQILNKPTLATVATSGDYDDLINKPTIPAAQVSSDWNATSGVAQILHKPSLATVATSGSYNDLSNKPTIPTVDSAMSTTSTNPVQNKVVNSTITAHTGDTSNPHSVTKAQVGLGNVVNTGDSATPTQNGTAKFTTGGAYTLQQSINAASAKASKVVISGTEYTATWDSTTGTLTLS